jgi:hypothetical protein
MSTPLNTKIQSAHSVDKLALNLLGMRKQFSR